MARRPLPYAPWIMLVSSVLVVLAVLYNSYLVPWETPGVGLWKNSIDLRVYWLVGQRVAEGRALYGESVVGQLPFTYPPFAALMLWGLSFLSFGTLVWVWRGMGVLLLTVVVALVFRERGYRLDAVTWYCSLTLAVASVLLDPIRSTFLFGQINIVLMLLVALGFLQHKDRWGVGVGMGLAAGIKLTPGFFFIVLAVQRRWKTLATSVVVGAATVVVGWLVFPEDSRTFWLTSMMQTNRVGSYLNTADQSIQAVVFRMNGGPTRWWWLGEVLCFLLVVVTLWWVRHLNNYSLMMGLGGVSACLLSPFSWNHHFVWVLPLLLALCEMLVAQWRDMTGWWRSLHVVGIVGLAAAMGAWVHHPYEDAPFLIGAPLATMSAYPYWLWQGVYVFTMLVVLVGAGAWAMVSVRGESDEVRT